MRGDQLHLRSKPQSQGHHAEFLGKDIRNTWQTAMGGRTQEDSKKQGLCKEIQEKPLLQGQKEKPRYRKSGVWRGVEGPERTGKKLRRY